MQCPRCGYVLDELDPVCPRCHAEEEQDREQLALFLTQRSHAGAAEARAALEATGWNLRQAFARLGVTPPPGPLPGERPVEAAGPLPKPDPAPIDAKPKGFGTPGTRASKGVTIGICVVGAALVVGVVVVCLGMFGIAGPIRKTKTAEMPPVGAPPDITMTADALWEEYSTNKAQGQSKYGGRFARLSGTVSGVELSKSGRVEALIGGDPVTGCKCRFAEGEGKDLARGQQVVIEGMVDDFAVHVIVTGCRVVSASGPAGGGAGDAGATELPGGLELPAGGGGGISIDE